MEPNVAELGFTVEELLNEEKRKRDRVNEMSSVEYIRAMYSIV
jgi:hypothetical protein